MNLVETSLTRPRTICCCLRNDLTCRALERDPGSLSTAAKCCSLVSLKSVWKIIHSYHCYIDYFSLMSTLCRVQWEAGVAGMPLLVLRGTIHRQTSGTWLHRWPSGDVVSVWLFLTTCSTLWVAMMASRTWTVLNGWFSYYTWDIFTSKIDCEINAFCCYRSSHFYGFLMAVNECGCDVAE